MIYIPNKLRKEVRSVNKKVLLHTILSAFIYWIVFLKRKKITELGPVSHNYNKKMPWYYWYGNTTEHLPGPGETPLDYNACWYGDENWRKTRPIPRIFGKTFPTSFVWNVIRNGYYNGRYRLGSKWRGPILKGSVVIFKNTWHGKNAPEGMATMFRNKKYPGEQLAMFLYERSGAMGYRESSTIKKGRWWYNKMEGTGQGAAVFKRRRFKKLDK